MKRLTLSLIILAACTGQAWGATKTVCASGCDYANIAAVNAASFSAGDVIDGQNETYIVTASTDRLIPPSSGSSGGGYITFQNMVIEGAVSYNANCAMTGSSTYSCAGGATYAWTQYSGEIYQKRMASYVYQLLEDDVQMTPILYSNVDAMERGQFTMGGGTTYLYYRASDGSAPDTHVLKGTNRAVTNYPNMVYVNNVDYIKLKHITVNHASAGGTDVGVIGIFDADHVSIENCTLSENNRGILAKNSTNVSVDAATTVTLNYSDGLAVAGTADTIDLSGTYTYNGATQVFTSPTSVGYTTGDKGGIGIGGAEGNQTSITIHNAIVTNNGPPACNASTSQGGIYFGSSAPKVIRNITVRNSYIANNQGTGLYLDDCMDATIYGNVIAGNANLSSNSVHGILLSNNVNLGFTSGKIYGNTIASNRGPDGLYLTHTGAVDVKNNLFYDNGRPSSGSCGTTTTYGHLYTKYLVASWLTESNNLYYASGMGSDRLINDNATHVYTHSQLANWQSASGKGSGDVVSDPLLTATYGLNRNSPAIEAGLYLDGAYALGYNGTAQGCRRFDIGAMPYGGCWGRSTAVWR